VNNTKEIAHFIELWQERIAEENLPWEQLALSAFQFQSQNVPIYKEWLRLINCNPSQVTSVIQIPFLPIELFKNHTVLVNDLIPETVFFSSGTTGMALSNHYVYRKDYYLENCVRIFKNWQGSLTNCVFFALLPHYLERSNSSLVAMVKHFMEESGNGEHFYLNDLESLQTNINEAASTGKKIVLFGVTFALLEYVKQGFALPPNTIVIETGGMKGMGKELIRTELHEILKSGLGLEKIYSEYGMSELYSQCYTDGSEWFTESETMKVLLREPDNPFEVNRKTGKGAFNVIDLANIHSCCFIATADQGKHNGHISFTVEGRLDNTDIRGCNLLSLNL
jgi:hypothetical protein